jgi:hypothetical protein
MLSRILTRKTLYAFGLFLCFSCNALCQTLVVVPMSGEPEKKISFYGSGFVPGEKVRIILTVDDVPLAFGSAGTAEPFTGGGIVTANESGAFKLVPVGGIPVSIKPGVYTVEAIGDKGSRATAPLEVLERTHK